MGPQKRRKPNPKAEAHQRFPSDGAQEGTQQQEMVDTPHIKVDPKPTEDTPKSAIEDSAQTTENGPSTPKSTTSWYGGTWPRVNKSTPVTQVAKESISAAGTAAGKVASDAVASARASSPRPSSISSTLRSPASYLSRGAASSTRSLPLTAAPTKLNITSSATDSQNGNAEAGLKKHRDSAATIEVKAHENNDDVSKDENKSKATPQNEDAKNDAPSTLYSQRHAEGKPGNESSSWLGWFSKADSTAITGSSRPQSVIAEVPKEASPSPTQRRNSEPNPSSPLTQQGESSRSWLSIWGTTAKETSSSANAAGVSTSKTAQPDNQSSKDNTVDASIKASGEPAEMAKSYGWAFWSKDDSRDAGGKKRRPSNVGQLALAGSPSQSKPENAVVDESKGIPDRVSKRPKTQSMQETDETPKVVDVKAPSKQESRGFNVPELSKPATISEVKAPKQDKNLLLPSFKKTYRTTNRPGLIQQLSRLFQLGPSSEPKHVDISSPRKVTRALAIGVHGYFPAPLIRSVLGQPTGTSIRFANSAASAIQKWCQDQGYSCEIEKVALEGEGKIAERIDLLWKLILNWIDKIRKADFVMIACHSQGVPVAMMLVAKLINFGCVSSARIGVCAMAGVNLGPFADYKSRWISGSAGELFDFALPDSQVSKDYEAALDVALRFGVRIVYVGSIDDQLVSLESSTFGALSHPYVYRAVFVDGRVHAPDFLTHLVGFALKLRNLGISDHGLIRELSSPLAGSLYGGEGHSRIYDDEAVYYLTVEHALETTSIGNVPIQVQRAGVPSGQNPYILPFAMRGLLEEEHVRTELYGEITDLIRQFDDWKPQKTVLKDVKFRLEGVRSKL